MDYSFKATAKQSLKELDKRQAEEILKLIEEIAEQGFNNDKVKMIKDGNGDWVYRIKAAEENSNHRVFIDYSGGKLKILDILHRSIAYEGKYGNG